MIRCPKCNSDNLDEALYCKSCQYRLREVKIIDEPQAQNNKPAVNQPQPTIESPPSNEPSEASPLENKLRVAVVVDFIRRYLILFLLLILSITYFTRNSCRNVQEIAPEVLKAPTQTEIGGDPALIRFTRNGYAYQLAPLYHYELNGLIVGKMNYRIFGLGKFGRIFPVDLCIIWGNNVSTRVYRNPAIKFSQDCRWCWVEWFGSGITFNFDELSNSHLLINSDKLERKLKALMRGDQVKIIGTLVNVKANIVGKPGSFDAPEYTWNTSVSRTDSGAGACEVIYVQDMVILKKANVFSYYVFKVSLYGLLILIAWKVFQFMRKN